MLMVGCGVTRGDAMPSVYYYRYSPDQSTVDAWRAEGATSVEKDADALQLNCTRAGNWLEQG